MDMTCNEIMIIKCEIKFTFLYYLKLFKKQEN